MIQVLLEAEAGSSAKNRYDEKTLELKGTGQISRPYPYPYGFIIGTIATDGDSIDCYIITKDTLKAGMIVECEPIGLLEQVEDGDVDHKVLASIPGQDVILSQELQEELRDFIYAVFAQFPEVHVNIGRILPREMALQHIQKHQDG
jgi:inorganic pyrophosphatase